MIPLLFIVKNKVTEVLPFEKVVCLMAFYYSFY